MRPLRGAGELAGIVLIDLTLNGDSICAITYFGDRGVFPTSGFLERCRAR